MDIRLALLFLASLLITTSSTAAEPLELRAGPVSMTFEPENAMLRYLRVGRQKILQGITAPVRDQNWGTVRPAVSDVQLRQAGGSFTLDFDVACREGEIDFAWHGRIVGDGDGRIVFTFDGEARSSFLRNRIGFCVLHGPEAAGQPCVVETVDGERVEGRFPAFISPHQPFKNLRAIRHRVADGVWASVRMEGDTFEMEDQRNWTDASFKTYCTPLDLPLPVRVAEGTRISQRVEISLEGEVSVAEQGAGAGGVVVLQVAASAGRLPRIGLQVSRQVPELTGEEIDRLRGLHLDHLRVDLGPVVGTAKDDLRRAARQAERLGVELLVGLHLAEENPERLLGELVEVGDGIASAVTWLVISASDEQYRTARELLSTHIREGGGVGRGEDTNFTELNRNRPDPSVIDVVSYGVNPQIHAFDDTSMVETLAIQADTLRSARRFVGDVPVLVSPITLLPQRRAATPVFGALPPDVDVRQATLFAAAWTLGSLKYLADAGADWVTYFETVGWRGVMESESGPPLPSRFPSRSRQLFPVFHVFREVGEFAGATVREVNSSDPLSVVGLALEKEDRRRVLLANLTAVSRRVLLRGHEHEPEHEPERIAVRRLDDGNAAAAGRSARSLPGEVVELQVQPGGGLELELPPHGIAILDPR